MWSPSSIPYMVSYDTHDESLARFFKCEKPMDLIFIINAFDSNHEFCGFVWLPNKSEPEFMFFDNNQSIRILSDVEEELTTIKTTENEVTYTTWKALVESIDMTKVVWLLFSQKVRRGW